MEQYNLYKDIKARTNGEIYLGVVGAVRTGKSTFIKRFMEQMVIPNIEDENVRSRTRDELPQSAQGKTIMTTEPKFIPKDAAEIKLTDDIKVKIRLIDCQRTSGKRRGAYGKDAMVGTGDSVFAGSRNRDAQSH